MNCKAVQDTIVDWLKNKLEESGQTGFVVGVSGGVDSALVSTLCALTKKPLWLLSMPIYQAPDQVKRADDHMAWLSERGFVTIHNIDLTTPFEAIQKSFPEFVGKDPLAMVNTRSRLRMVTLYAFAGAYQLLVAGTGNLVEDYGIGFFTKYGDGGVDLSPIGSLSKTQVWELAKFVGVSDEIVQAKPTDGLWSDNRGDEDAIGATYPELEWAMAECETKGINPQRSLGIGEGWTFSGNYSERQKHVLKIYLQRHTQNKHKLTPIPICPIPSVLL